MFFINCPEHKKCNSNITSRKIVCKWDWERQLKDKWKGEELKYLLESCLFRLAADYHLPTPIAINCIYIYPWHFLLRYQSKHFFLVFMLTHTSNLQSAFKTFTLSVCKPLTLKNIKNKKELNILVNMRESRFFSLEFN